MFPVYGRAGRFCLSGFIRWIGAQPWALRGLVWTGAAFAVEYIAGWPLRKAVGECPWDYSGTPFSVRGLIRLDYAPAWFALGLFFERLYLRLLVLFPKSGLDPGPAGLRHCPKGRLVMALPIEEERVVGAAYFRKVVFPRVLIGGPPKGHPVDDAGVLLKDRKEVAYRWACRLASSGGNPPAYRLRLSLQA